MAVYKRDRYHDAYANLAAAIIESGQVSHDESFLESDWCASLKEICRLDDEMHGGAKAILHRQKYTGGKED